MFKILLALLLLSPSAWATQWRNGTGEQTILGTSNAGLIGYNSYNSIVQPLDNLLSNYCNEYLQYNSSSIITVVAGTCAVSNSQGTIRLFMMDTANTNLTSANLDTGSITANTTYYVYATAASTSTTTSTYYISASNTAPSGQTYYYQIGSFATDANSNFTTINNKWIGGEDTTWSSKSPGVIYQALTALNVQAYCGNTGSSNTGIEIQTGSASNLSGAIISCYNDIGSNTGGVVFCKSKIRAGDYYEVTQLNGCTGAPQAIYVLPTNY